MTSQTGESVGTSPPLGSGRVAGSWLRSLANARVFLAIAALAAVYVDPSEPSRFPALAYPLIWLYLAFSIGARALVMVRALPSWSVLAVHAVDVVFPCVLIVFAEGPSSPFFVLLPFALLAAGHRWGYRAQTEAAFVADMFGVVRARPGVTEMIARLAERITRAYAARRGLLAVHDLLTGRGMLWEYDPTAPEGARLRSTRLGPTDHAIYLAPETRECWQETRDPVKPICERHRCGKLLGCKAPLGESIEARLYLLDSAGAPVSAQKLAFLGVVVGQVGPAVYNGYLLHRPRSRVAIAERQRLASELHDGLVQTLLGLELTVESCRRRDADPAGADKCLVTVRDGLRGRDRRAPLADRRAVVPRRDAAEPGCHDSFARHPAAARDRHQGRGARAGRCRARAVAMAAGDAARARTPLWRAPGDRIHAGCGRGGGRRMAEDRPWLSHRCGSPSPTTTRSSGPGCGSCSRPRATARWPARRAMAPRRWR